MRGASGAAARTDGLLRRLEREPGAGRLLLAELREPDFEPEPDSRAAGVALSGSASSSRSERPSIASNMSCTNSSQLWWRSSFSRASALRKNSSSFFGTGAPCRREATEGTGWVSAAWSALRTEFAPYGLLPVRQ